MKNLSARLVWAALAVLPTTGTAARADLVHWSYSWSNSPTQVLSDGAGNSRITLTDEGLQTIIGDSDIVSTNLRTASTAPNGSPDTFTNRPYVLSLTLTDL